MMMVDHSLVGRCGLYCGACGIYRAYRDGGEPRRVLAEQFKIPEDKVRCEGCSALTPECWGTGCKIVECLDGKGYGFCYDCPEHAAGSCEKYEKLSARYAKLNIDVRANLDRIRAGEAEGWLAEQDTRWRCSGCGRPVSCHSPKCYHCGKVNPAGNQ